jgi:hypothetical protein
MRATYAIASLTLAGAIVVTVNCGDDPPPAPIDPVVGGAGGEGGGGGEGPIQGIVSESPLSTFETDPQLSANDDVIAIVWTGSDDVGSPTHIGYTISTDRGASFSEPAFIESEDGDEYYNSPDVIVDNGGNVYVTFLGYHRTVEGGAIYVAESDGGDELGAPEVVTDAEVVGFYQRPRIILTNTSRLVVAYTQLVDETPQTRLALRAQTANEWTRLDFSMDGARHIGPTLCAAAATPMGRTYLVELVQGNYYLHYSEDNGDTWTGGIPVAVDGDQVSGLPSCVASGQNVWVSYGTRGSGGLDEIKVAYSADGGDTFMYVGVVSEPELTDVFALNQLAVEPPETAHLAYYLGAGPGDQLSSVRRVRFSPTELEQMPPMEDDPPLGLPSAVVKEPVSLQTGGEDPRWLGESIGVDFGDDNIYIAYVDNADGESHIAFAAIEP